MEMILKQSHETEVYLSETGYLVIKQSDWTQEENMIFLSPDQAAQLMSFIKNNEIEHRDLWLQPLKGGEE